MGIQNNLEVRDSSCVSRLGSSSGLFYGLEILHGIFWGVKFWARDFFWFLYLPPFDHPCHLKSGVPPWALNIL